MNETKDDLNDHDPIDYAQLGRFGFGEGVNNCELAMDIGDGFFLSVSKYAPWDIQTVDDCVSTFYLRDMQPPKTYGELRNILRVLGVEPKA